jgi:hypothetical protein
MSRRKECVLHGCWVEYSVDVNYVHLSSSSEGSCCSFAWMTFVLVTMMYSDLPLSLC